MKLDYKIARIISLGLLWLTIAYFFTVIVRNNNGQFVYAIDDAYIHMSMAKNLAEYRVYGVTRYDFSGSSSSIIYPILIAIVYKIFGVNLYTPLILNIIFASVLIYVICVFLERIGLKPIHTILFSVIVILFTPLTSLIFIGMEHTLQTLSVILFVYYASQTIVKDNHTRNDYILIALLGMFVTSVRYEGTLVVVAVGVILLSRKLWKLLFALCTSIIPPLIYATISLFNGWFYMPGSILTKRAVLISVHDIPSLMNYITICISVLIVYMPWIALLMLATILILIDNQNKDNKWIDKNVLIIIFLITATLHIFFAQNNHLFRYEAYLVCFGMFVITYNIDRYIAILKSKKTNKYTVKRAIIVIVVTYLVMCPIVIRGFGAFNAIPKASHNIYEQQYQMANFVHEYYDGDLIILNDIGLVNYISDIKLIDLEGLGTLSVAKQKLVNKTLQKSYINEIAMQNNASLAIVYDFWYKDNIPIDWTKVGTWTIPNNVICGNETISFYAINPNEVEPLQKHLKEFNLPSDVKQEILYNKRDR